jgi:hypothetical protein
MPADGKRMGPDGRPTAHECDDGVRQANSVAVAANVIFVNFNSGPPAVRIKILDGSIGLFPDF